MTGKNRRTCDEVRTPRRDNTGSFSYVWNMDVITSIRENFRLEREPNAFLGRMESFCSLAVDIKVLEILEASNEIRVRVSIVCIARSASVLTRGQEELDRTPNHNQKQTYYRRSLSLSRTARLT